MPGLQRKSIVEGTFGRPANAETPKENEKTAQDTEPLTPKPPVGTPSPSGESAPLKPASSASQQSTGTDEDKRAEDKRAEDKRAEDTSTEEGASHPDRQGPPGTNPSSGTAPGAGKTDGRKNTSRRRQSDQKAIEPWARAAVNRSRQSAKRRPREWGKASVRLANYLHGQLEERMLIDYEEHKEKYSIIYYVNAALEAIPDNPDAAAKWVNDYLDRHESGTPESTGTTSRLHREVAANFEALALKLRVAHGFGLTGHLQSAAVEKLLNALRLEDQGHKPIDLDNLSEQ